MCEDREGCKDDEQTALVGSPFLSRKRTVPNHEFSVAEHLAEHLGHVSMSSGGRRAIKHLHTNSLLFGCHNSCHPMVTRVQGQDHLVTRAQLRDQLLRQFSWGLYARPGIEERACRERDNVVWFLKLSKESVPSFTTCSITLSPTRYEHRKEEKKPLLASFN